MTTETRTDHPLIWAHANTPAAVDAVREVLMRAKLSEPTLSYVLTAPDSEVTYAPDVVVLDEADHLECRHVRLRRILDGTRADRFALAGKVCDQRRALWRPPLKA